MSAVTIVVLVFLAGCVGYVVVLLRNYIVSKMGKENYDYMNAIIEDIVRYCEQMGKNVGWTSEDKKAMAVVLCRQIIELFGLKVDAKLIDTLIERAVQIVNESSVTIGEMIDDDYDLDI